MKTSSRCVPDTFLSVKEKFSRPRNSYPIHPRTLALRYGRLCSVEHVLGIKRLGPFREAFRYYEEEPWTASRFK